MTEYTTIYFDYGMYHNNKVKIKRIINRYGLLWNSGKVRDLGNEDILRMFEVFGSGDKISGDDKLKNRAGSSGVWESGNNAVKIVMFEKVCEDEHLPVLMVVKGEINTFYQELIKYVAGLGCEVGKLVENDGKFEEVFKKKINVELIEKLNDITLKKEMIKNNFLCYVMGFSCFDSDSGFGSGFSEFFVKEWIKCIDKYGDYTYDKLLWEIENKNKKNVI